jgi:hypothetical protein
MRPTGTSPAPRVCTRFTRQVHARTSAARTANLLKCANYGQALLGVLVGTYAQAPHLHSARATPRYCCRHASVDGCAAACHQHLSRRHGLSAAFPSQAREQAAAAAAAPAVSARPASTDKVQKSVLILAAPGELAAAVQPEPAAGASAAGAIAAAAHARPADAAAAAKAADEARAAAREQAIKVSWCSSVELAVHACIKNAGCRASQLNRQPLACAT